MTTRIQDVNLKNLDLAVAAALDGPERKKIKICRHEFNVKPVKLTRSDDNILIDGGEGHHISHHVSMAPDDQIYYSIRARKGVTLGEINPDITYPNKWAVWAKEVFTELEKHKGLIVAAAGFLFKADGGSSAILEATVPTLDRDNHSWRSEALFLMQHITLAAAARET